MSKWKFKTFSDSKKSAKFIFNLQSSVKSRLWLMVPDLYWSIAIAPSVFEMASTVFAWIAACAWIPARLRVSEFNSTFASCAPSAAEVASSSSRITCDCTWANVGAALECGLANMERKMIETTPHVTALNRFLMFQRLTPPQTHFQFPSLNNHDKCVRKRIFLRVWPLSRRS